jgi:hypothetical protein
MGDQRLVGILGALGGESTEFAVVLRKRPHR